MSVFVVRFPDALCVHFSSDHVKIFHQTTFHARSGCLFELWFSGVCLFLCVSVSVNVFAEDEVDQV